MEQIPTLPLSSSMAVIVPAFNEENGMVRVLAALLDCSFLHEIVIVDDGSTDATWSVANGYCQQDNRVKAVRHEHNLGKGQALLTGLNESISKTIVTVDADLWGLKPEHMRDLVKPVVDHQCDMSYAVFKQGQWNTDLAHILTPWLTGQRCLRRELFRQISWRAAAGYGLETAITVAAQRADWHKKKIFWKGVFHPPSEGHRGLIRGIYTRLRMYLHILRAWQLATQDAPTKKYLPSTTNRSS
jgi:glycosyltransferase involved in cell wall biosynthesis